MPKFENSIEGFIFKGVSITDPHLEETGRFEVDPKLYYGEYYVSWLEFKSKPRIIECKIIDRSHNLTQSLINGKAKVMVKYKEDQEFELLFDFYNDEVDFKEQQFIGKTKQEGISIFSKKDIAYLQS